jgi:photosystem II stability/assembly factor-like uncharacterized protein
MKKIFPTRTKLVLSLSAMLAVVFVLCYGAFAQARRDDAQHANKDGIAVSPAAQTPDCDGDGPQAPRASENDPEFLKLRREWLERFYGLGPGRVPTDAYLKALSAARALPLSPLVQNWTFQALSPMWNDWGNGGCPCHRPFPPNSPCGASVRIEAIAVHPTNADIVYVGSEGGLAKSVDAGQNWTYLSDNLPSQSIRSISIDPVAPNIIYAGTGVSELRGVGIYRSTDSGATWTINIGPPQFRTIGQIAIDPGTAGSPTSTTLYASVTGSGIHSVWKSTNSGTNWTQIKGGLGAGTGTFYDLAIDPRLPVPPASARTLYATAPNGLFKTTDGGATWSNSLHPVPQPTAASYLAVVQNKLYFAFQESGGSTSIANSTNEGSSWASLPSAPCVPQPTPEPPFCAGLSCFGVDPSTAHQPSPIFVGGGGDLVYSLDSGNTWMRSHDVHVDMHSLAFCKANPDRNYLGTDGGIYRADNGGSGEITWYSKNENLAGSLMYGISISRDDHIAMGNQDNGTQLGWTGRNPPWTHIYGGDGWKPKIDQTDSSKVYYVSYTGDEHETCDPLPRQFRVGPNSHAPYRWVNGVETNVTPSDAYCELSWFFPAMFVAPGNSARVVMGFQNVYRSVNSGASWTRIGGGTSGIDPNKVMIALYEAPSNTDVIYAISAAPPINNGYKVFVTTNAGQGNGATWTPTSNLPGGIGIRAVTVHPTSPQTAYLASQGVYKTTNMGATWILSGFANLGCYDVAIDPVSPEHIFAATDSGVYASTDGGTTWGSTTGIPAGMVVSSLSFNATSRQLAASTYGRGVYMLDLDDVIPTVSITSPLDGATVSGGVTISATASDNHNVAGVRFKVDGADIGAEVTSPPYLIGWNTTLWTNGSHTLTAVARDPAGNTTTSAQVKVKVNN